MVTEQSLLLGQRTVLKSKQKVVQQFLASSASRLPLPPQTFRQRLHNYQIINDMAVNEANSVAGLAFRYQNRWAMHCPAAGATPSLASGAVLD
jgi:hypothetical protein